MEECAKLQSWVQLDLMCCKCTERIWHVYEMNIVTPIWETMHGDDELLEYWLQIYGFGDILSDAVIAEKPKKIHQWICSPYCCICLNRGTVSLIFAKYAINAYLNNLEKKGELQFDVIYNEKSY